MSHLKTDWLCVATEGDTVDGRVIERQWIIDMGETYDFNHYVALLWPEHDHSGASFGEVLEATWRDGDDGLARLYVSLCPNIRLLYANEEGQLLFFSIEPEEDWRGTGRFYLKGLAVTNRPASVGTTRMRFSERRLSKQGYYRCVLTSEGKIKQGEKMSKKKWQSYFGIKPKFEEESPSEEAPQGDDKLQALANAVNEIEGRLATIENTLQEMQGDVDTIAEVVDTEEFAELRSNAKEIVNRFNDLGSKGGQRKQRQVPSKFGKFNFL